MLLLSSVLLGDGSEGTSKGQLISERREDAMLKAGSPFSRRARGPVPQGRGYRLVGIELLPAFAGVAPASSCILSQANLNPHTLA